jgi:carbon monoxide dehydrogenase subunit G
MALELTHRFPVTKPVDEAFAMVLDLDRIVPCVDGGRVLARTGPTSAEAEIAVGMAGQSMTYRGTIDILEHDLAAHRAVMEVKSSEVSGQGDANARVEFIVAENEGTINTTALLTGTAMSMGESVALGVLEALIAAFATNLAAL